MKRWILLAFGTAFIAVASLLASEQAWIEAVSESFVPYGAVPLVIGYVSRQAGVGTAAVWGAGANAVLVVAFYVVRPVLDPPHAVQWSDLFYWTAIGVVCGALLAVFAWWLRSRASGNQREWAVGAWVFLVVVQMAAFLYSGWGRIDVDTGSGTVTIGYSTTDIVIASVVLAAFHLLLILIGMQPPDEPSVGQDLP